MSPKLENLLRQVAEEKARITAKARADEKRRVEEISRLVVKAGMGSLPMDFLEKSFARIVADHAKNGG